MPKETKKSGGKVQNEKVSGTTKPLPTAEDEVRDPAKDKELSDLAKAQNAALEAKKKEIEEKRAKLKELQAQLKAERDAEKAIKDAEAAAKKAKADEAKKAKEEAEAAVKAADERVKAAEENLKLTEEWAELEAAKAARAAIGPIPRVRKAREGGGGGTRGKSKNGLTPNMIRVLEVMADGEERTSSQLAEATGIVKGKRLPELVELGYMSELVPEEGTGRGKRFVITDAGREALEKANSAEEADEAPAEGETAE